MSTQSDCACFWKTPIFLVLCWIFFQSFDIQEKKRIVLYTFDRVDNNCQDCDFRMLAVSIQTVLDVFPDRTVYVFTNTHDVLKRDLNHLFRGKVMLIQIPLKYANPEFVTKSYTRANSIRYFLVRDILQSGIDEVLFLDHDTLVTKGAINLLKHINKPMFNPYPINYAKHIVWTDRIFSTNQVENDWINLQLRMHKKYCNGVFAIGSNHLPLLLQVIEKAKMMSTNSQMLTDEFTLSIVGAASNHTIFEMIPSSIIFHYLWERRNWMKSNMISQINSLYEHLILARFAEFNQLLNETIITNTENRNKMGFADITIPNVVIEEL